MAAGPVVGGDTSGADADRVAGVDDGVAATTVGRAGLRRPRRRDPQHLYRRTFRHGPPRRETGPGRERGGVPVRLSPRGGARGESVRRRGGGPPGRVDPLGSPSAGNRGGAWPGWAGGP